MTKEKTDQLNERLIPYLERAKRERISFRSMAKIFLNENRDINLSADRIRKKLGKLTDSKLKEETGISVDNEKTIDLSNSAPGVYEYKGTKSIRTEQEAIDFFNIDTERYDIIKFKYNAWDTSAKNKEGEFITTTNYQVTVLTEPKEESDFNFTEARKVLDKSIKKSFSKRVSGSGKALLSITDIHVGATTDRGLIKTREFSFDKLVEYLNQVVVQVNQLNKEEVSVAILGDLVESFTGLNHINSWQELETWQGDALIMVYELLDDFLSKINNLGEVYMISGNHDRTTADKNLDRKGSVAQLVSYMLGKQYRVKYHPMILTVIYDNICYVLSHGHLPMLKNLPSLLYNYGNQNYYNVVISGHLHSRRKKTNKVKNKPTFSNIPNSHFDQLIEGVSNDQNMYRHITVPALFTGNLFSESLGYTSSPGFVLTERSPFNNRNINCYDYGL